MSDDTRNGTTHAPTATDVAHLLAAVKGLLPPPAVAEIEAWSRGERSAEDAAGRLRELANGTAAPPGPRLDDLTQELIDFEAQFPPPNEKEIFADCRWIQDHWIDDSLSPYRGTHVAVFNGAVVGSGGDSVRLQLDAARKLNVHPQRLVVVYVPRGGGFF